MLPIVPPYLAYMSGVSMSDMTEDRAAARKATVTALFFVMGLSTVFLFLGFTASAMGGRCFCKTRSISISSQVFL